MVVIYAYVLPGWLRVLRMLRVGFGWIAFDTGLVYLVLCDGYWSVYCGWRFGWWFVIVVTF